MTGTQNPDLLASLVGTWALDASATTVQLHTKAMWGMAKVSGSFAALEGAGSVGADGSVTGTIVLDAASVDTSQARRDKHLRSKDFFDVERFPTFSYAVTSARAEPDGSVTIEGAFTAHGQTNPLTVSGEVRVTDTDTATVTAQADLDRRRWGMAWAKMGARMDNHVVVTAVFRRS